MRTVGTAMPHLVDSRVCRAIVTQRFGACSCMSRRHHEMSTTHSACRQTVGRMRAAYAQ
jgi:hypothetical protein